jgi:hypothetical protein
VFVACGEYHTTTSSSCQVPPGEEKQRPAKCAVVAVGAFPGQVQKADGWVVQPAPNSAALSRKLAMRYIVNSPRLMRARSRCSGRVGSARRS